MLDVPRESIERLYSVFSRYPHPDRLEGCPCCTSEADSRRLLSIPLRELSAERLERYAFKALSTWGSVEDYKYFLPRILELSLGGDLLCELEITLRKLAYGEIGSWPPDERTELEKFVRVAWKRAVELSDTGTADSILCGAASFMDVSPLLSDAQPEFRDLYRADCTRPDKKRLTNSFWDQESLNYRRVVEWVYGSRASA